MSRVDIVEHEGKEIVKADLSNLGVEEAVSVMQEATEVIKTKPRNSVLFLTDVHGVSYSRETVSGIKEFSISNSLFIKATAVVGMDVLKPKNCNISIAKNNGIRAHLLRVLRHQRIHSHLVQLFVSQ